MTPLLKQRESIRGELPADLSAVAPALALMRDWTSLRGLSDSALGRLELAAAEAVNNAILHGCAGKPGATVTLEWSWCDPWLELSITDPGFFQPGPKWSELPEDPLAENGRGGFLISTSVDAWEHTNDSTGHTIKLSVRAGAPAQALPRDAKATMDGLTQELSDAYEQLAALFKFGELLATAEDYNAFAGSVCNLLAERLEVRSVQVRSLVDLGGLATLCRAGTCDDLRTTRGSGDFTEARAAQQRNEIVVEDCAELPICDPLSALGAGGALVLPIDYQGTCFGVLVLACGRFGSFFSAGDVGLARAVADFLGNARALSESQRRRQAEERSLREVEIAAGIQRSLIPTAMPRTGDVRVSGVCRSAERTGGDFYDHLPSADGGAYVVIADVMGKGLPAALFATVLRATLRCCAPLARSPAELLTEVNEHLFNDLNALDTFITAQIVHIPAGGRRLTFASAGHCPLLVLDPEGRNVRLRPEGNLPLGIMPDTTYVDAAFELDRGSAALLVTDGLYERPGRDGRTWSIHLLRDTLASVRAEGPLPDAANLLSHLDNAAGLPAEDDCTLVVIQA